ncbi:hypothetical protein [Kosakonia sacchari]|uniref:hypothetical protein n=1 Tax=Kosakonia sacchari TaxID=1158459 RepID=UPI003F55A082
MVQELARDKFHFSALLTFDWSGRNDQVRKGNMPFSAYDRIDVMGESHFDH